MHGTFDCWELCKSRDLRIVIRAADGGCSLGLLLGE